MNNHRSPTNLELAAAIFGIGEMVLKQRKNQPPIVVRAGIISLLVVSILSVVKTSGWLDRLPSISQLQEQLGFVPREPENSAVLPLSTLPAAQRAEKLEAIATGSRSLDRSRARYLLASDLIQQKQGEKALPWLEGLEWEYPVLAAHIAFKRAQAYEVSGTKEKAMEAWKQLLNHHGKDPVAAEALFALGRTDEKYWERAIAEFPSHPRTIEIVNQRLKQNPDQLPLLLLLVKHAPDSSGINPVIERLTKQYAAELKPEDWEAIAYIHWQNQVYGKAGEAYARAPRTALNLYRAGRGNQLGDNRSQAVISYRKLVQEFPEAPETGTALLRLADLSKTPQEAISYLDLAISKFPDKAGEALLFKARILDRNSDTQGATEAIQLALTKYDRSDAVAEYRWKEANRQATAGNLREAWKLAQLITSRHPEGDLAPQAGFWVGKWAKQLGRQQEAKAAFEHVLANYPTTYYAWRSAVMLGWNVGDFTTVRPLSPDVVRPIERPLLPSGSKAVQELHLLGEDRDAWRIWQVEFSDSPAGRSASRNRIQPKVEDQFTDGLLRLGMGDNLKGILKVSSLDWRETPEEKEQLAALKQQPVYWQALYPFPFVEFIETWSQKRQLNPLLVTALIRQESRFEPAIRSVAGATGLMQVIPSTGKWIAQAINLTNFSLENPNDNVNLGTWYLDYTHREYRNNSLLAVASYNAGPGNVSKWLNQKGLSDPDRFVESIPFDETKGYVKNVFSNYWNYMRLYNPEVAQLLARYQRK